MLVEVSLDAIDQRIALVARERARQKLRDAWIGIQLRERSAVRRAKAAQEQSLGPDHISLPCRSLRTRRAEV